MNADATQFTFYLRKGLKWSDGKPFTADDTVFAIEDCAKNAELYKATPSQLVIGGKPVICEKVDDTTVKFTFRRALCLVPRKSGNAAGPAYDAVREALLQPVPPEI